MSREAEMPPRGSKVYVDVFPDLGEWSVEVGLVDESLHKTFGNPLLLDTCEDEDEARMTGETFAASEGYAVEAVRQYNGREEEKGTR
jgi:hypothetical protein